MGPVRLRRHMRYEGLILELIWSPHMIWRLLFGRYGDFSIWSSSISAAASNPQANPYIVADIELLASYQYAGLNSIFIYQLRVGALLVRAPDHPPHPVCLQHPQRRSGWAKIQSVLIDTIREIISYHIISIDFFDPLPNKQVIIAKILTTNVLSFHTN